MTLSVTARYIDENGTWHNLPLESHVAGIETTRKSFYGGEVAVGAGLVILPGLLNEPMIYLHGDELAELKREVLVMWDLLDPYERDYWECRLGNILEAIELVAPYGKSGTLIVG